MVSLPPNFFLSFAAPLRSRTLTCIADVVAIMIQGRLLIDVGPSLASVSLVGIPKASSVIRPIAVGLALRGLTGKVALQLVCEAVVSHLQPLQLGVGVPRGAEAIFYTIHRYVSHHAHSGDRLIAQIDLSNAFNRISRFAVISAV